MYMICCDLLYPSVALVLRSWDIASLERNVASGLAALVAVHVAEKAGLVEAVLAHRLILFQKPLELPLGSCCDIGAALLSTRGRRTAVLFSVRHGSLSLGLPLRRDPGCVHFCVLLQLGLGTLVLDLGFTLAGFLGAHLLYRTLARVIPGPGGPHDRLAVLPTTRAGDVTITPSTGISDSSPAWVEVCEPEASLESWR